MPDPEAVITNLLDIEGLSTQEGARYLYRQALENALETGFELANDADLTTDQARFSLGIVLAIKHVLDPIIRDSRLAQSSIIKTIGGDQGNPHRAIDMVGSMLMDKGLASYAPWLGGGKLFVEERKTWQPLRKPIDTDMLHTDHPAPYNIILDPCDGTSHVTDGNPYLATAVTVLNPKNQFIASCLASLVTKAVIVVDKKTPHLYNYTPEFRFLGETPIPQPGTKARFPTRIATLDRRVPELIESGILRPSDTVTLRTFGGHAAIALVLGQVDLLIDPIKGQPLYEAIHWGWPLSQVGYWVSNGSGETINFPSMVGESQESGRMPRVPIIIAKNEAIGRSFLDRMHPLTV